MENIDIKKFVEDNLGKTVSFNEHIEDLDVSLGVIVGYREDTYVIISIDSEMGWTYDGCEAGRFLLKEEEGKTYWYMFPEDIKIID